MIVLSIHAWKNRKGKGKKKKNEITPKTNENQNSHRFWGVSKASIAAYQTLHGIIASQSNFHESMKKA